MLKRFQSSDYVQVFDTIFLARAKWWWKHKDEEKEQESDEVKNDAVVCVFMCLCECL